MEGIDEAYEDCDEERRQRAPGGQILAHLMGTFPGNNPIEFAGLIHGQERLSGNLESFLLPPKVSCRFSSFRQPTTSLRAMVPLVYSERVVCGK